MNESPEGVQIVEDGGAPERTRALLAVMVLAAVLRIGSYLLFPNIHYADEIFQHLEPAYRLGTGEGVITWEFREGIRSWWLPGVIDFIMRIGSLASESPSVY
ncbi:MAG: Alg9 family protein mannosyltransferase, partial [Hyphomicrobiales bacterium]|nr:Alg9 family protein mannosyltransferase [Hyphomicrobiales bacterium]